MNLIFANRKVKTTRNDRRRLNEFRRIVCSIQGFVIPNLSRDIFSENDTKAFTHGVS